jgi:hypothetical protein
MTISLLLAAAGLTPLKILVPLAGISGFFLHAALPPLTPSVEAAVLRAMSAA